MQYFSENSQAREGVMNFLLEFGHQLPAPVRATMLTKSSSASIFDVVVNLSEEIYAAKADMPKEGLILGAQLAAYRALYEWQKDEDGTNARARGIQYAMMRDAGEVAPEGVEYSDPESDPQPIGAPAPSAMIVGGTI